MLNKARSENWWKTKNY